MSSENEISKLKIAIVHDWLVTYAGSERVLEQILNIFPKADLFSLMDFLPGNERGFILNKTVKTTFIQKLPFAKKKYKQYLFLMPLAIEQHDLSGHDIVISSSHAVAKGVLTGPDQLHISYVHSPIRYAWDLQHQYLGESNLEKGIKGAIAKLLLHYIRMWDYRTGNGVNSFVANSHFIARRIRKVYGRSASVIYPPVDVEGFSFQAEKENFYLTAGRMTPYKRTDLIVEAFAQNPNRKLVVIGDGPEMGKVRKKAGGNVTFLGYQPFDVLKDYMQRAKAFVFAAEEDFGIVPLEAQACGTPVIAFGKGGALETICGKSSGKATGVFFDEQSPESLDRALDEFERESNLLPQHCRDNALRFSIERFREEFFQFVVSEWNRFQQDKNNHE